MQKTLKGEKYIYALMAIQYLENQKSEYEGTEQWKGYIKIGNDNGMKGGYQFQRIFRLVETDGKKYLIETKSSPHMADYSRAFEYRVYDTNIAIDTPTNWEH